MCKIYNNFDKIELVLDKTEYSIEDYKYILGKIKDEKSKLMFYYKVMFDNTNDAYFSLNLEKMMYFDSSFFSVEDKEMFNYINFMIENNNYKKTIYIVGFPEDNNSAIWKMLPFIWQKRGGLDVKCIFDDIDINEKYTFWCEKEIEVKSLKKMLKYKFNKDALFIIANPNYIHIKSFLINELAIKEENIFCFYYNGICQRNIQYFSEPFIKIDNNEILIDGGASDFETTLSFLAFCNWSYKKIWTIEPLLDQYRLCTQKTKELDLKNINIENVGLWKSEDELYFNIRDYGSSFISEKGDVKIKAKRIDDLLNGEKATIIKLDIEGAEYEAIEGACSTISKYDPILMLCVYHKKNDILKIAKKVLSINSKYTVFIRHYSYCINETVMYFVPRKKLIKYD